MPLSLLNTYPIIAVTIISYNIITVFNKYKKNIIKKLYKIESSRNSLKNIQIQYSNDILYKIMSSKNLNYNNNFNLIENTKKDDLNNIITDIIDDDNDWGWFVTH